MARGPRGPRPMPTYLKLIRGNPGQRRLDPSRELMPEQPDAPPEPPEFLEGLAREEWRRVIGELFSLRLVTSLDLMTLAAYCESFERWQTAQDKIKAIAKKDAMMAGLIVKTQSGGAAPNPLVLIADRAARDMMRYASEFGFSPAARSRIAAGHSTRPEQIRPPPCRVRLPLRVSLTREPSPVSGVERTSQWRPATSVFDPIGTSAGLTPGLLVC